MIISRMLGAIATSLMLGWSAHAATLIVDEAGQLTAVTGLEVDGTLWNIQLVEGVCSDLFTGCDDPSDSAFSTSSQALIANTALLNVLDGSSFESDPSTVFGCESIFFCVLLTPTGIIDGDVTGVAGPLLRAFGSPSVVGTAAISPSYDTTADENWVFAKWTPTPVPLPPALWLFTASVLGLFALSKRRRLAST